MTGILIFMIVSLFVYTFFLKHYHLSKCPKCNSYKITMDPLIDYTLFKCHTCKFSYKDYYSFYTLTSINEQLEFDFVYSNTDDMDN